MAVMYEDSMSSSQTALSIALGGVVVHTVYFQRYEYHRHLYSLLGISFAITAFYPYFLYRWLAKSPADSIYIATFHGGSLVGGAVLSTILYRLFLSPLNRFPGPFSARLTDFWLAFHVGKKLNQYQRLQDLHRRYGRIVRTGATHLSISDPTFVEPVLGYNATTVKGAWYDIDYPHHSLHEERDPAKHEAKRRLWAPAFSVSALRSYDREIQPVNRKFVQRITELEGVPMNITYWISIHMFLVMQATVFGKHDALTGSGEAAAMVEVLSSGMEILGLVLPPWFIRLLKLIPGNPLADFHAFTNRELENAVRSNFYLGKDADHPSSRSMVSWLHRIYEHEPDPATNALFRVDARLLITAGSETSASAMIYLFYLLAKHPDHVLIIREELGACIQGVESWSDVDINSCKHLNACIKEALRLFPPGPSGVFRLTPPQGLQVGEIYIPGNTNIQLPTFSVHRDASAYVQAEAFIPERWYSKPELIKNINAWVPFAHGPYQCIGKSLAMMEIRSLTAKVLLAHDVRLAPGEDGSLLLNESKDHFSMSLAPLNLVFNRVK